MFPFFCLTADESACVSLADEMTCAEFPWSVGFHRVCVCVAEAGVIIRLAKRWLSQMP